MDNIDKNALIAQFMGHKMETNGDFLTVGNDKPSLGLGVGFHAETLPYSYDWNYLMDVVEKIGGMTINGKWVGSLWDVPVWYSIGKVCTIFTIGDNDLFITDSSVGKMHKGETWKHSDKTPIYRTWLAVISFITWYNQQKENGTAEINS